MNKLPKVLIVEDDVVTSKYMNYLIDKLGYQVVSIVDSGEAAIVQSRQFNPDLVLMDIILQGRINGIDAANEIKKEQNIPIIYLTALSDGDTLREAQKSGPFGYIVKPFIERELEVIMAAALYKENKEQTLKDIQERHVLSLKNFRGISFRSDMDFMPLFISGSVEDIIGYKEADFIHQCINWDQIAHPEERPVISEELKSKFREIPNFQVNKEFRVISQEGRTKWIRHFIKNVCNANGKPESLVGTICDVTEYREIYDALEKMILNFDNLKKSSAKNEQQIISLKKEVNALYAELGRTVKYQDFE